MAKVIPLEMVFLVVQVAALVVQVATRQELVAQAIRHPRRHRKVIMAVLVWQREVRQLQMAAVVVVLVL